MNKVKEFNFIPKKAMVIFAHPDDAEIGTGGTIAKWCNKGTEVVYVLATTGSSGSNDLSMTSKKIVNIRSKEQDEAAKVLGVREIIELGYKDGELESNKQLLSDLVFLIRKFKPESVFTHDPFRVNGFMHKDHRNLGITVMDSIYPYARDHLHFSEQLNETIKPHKSKNLFFWGCDLPNTIIDVTGYETKKIESLSKHKSQIQGLSVGSSKEKGMLKRLHNYASNHPFKYGELFRMIEARD
ncbi:MAG: PIG-L deacetylase family protein [SAR202 cluster bacterium]|nr:PIG-L deacetylase family protein [SAR202 cluster bacterium]